jgi:membrane-bound serine protease (ClpP class)
MLAAIAAGLVLMRYLPKSRFGQRLMLDTELDAAGGYDSAPVRDADLLGRVGRSTSPLRPAGIAEIDGERVDVVSEGELIETGATIVVCRVDGNRVVVRRHSATTEDTTHA